MFFLRKNKLFLKYILIFLFLFFISLILMYVCLPVNVDEIWNYGFSYNISRGMVIYRDYNVLQTPLYFFIVSFFIRVFGSYLISMHIFDALLFSFIGIMLYRIIRWRFVVVMPFIMYFFPSGYNMLCLFFLILILYLINIKKDDDLLIALVIGLVLITKQNMGIILFIPCFLFSKRKLRSVIVFLFPFILLSIYLLFNGAFFKFIDYSFLGLFDFNQKNKEFYSLFVYLEILIVFYLGYCLYKVKFSNKEVIYILMFQFILYPLFDAYHFSVAFFPVAYLLIKNINKVYFISLFGTFSLLFYVLLFMSLDISIYKDCDMLFLRNSGDLVDLAIKLDNYVDDLNYLFSTNGYNYFAKLYFGVPIGQYDYLITGNMGYNGGKRKFKELSALCNEHKCTFVTTKDNLGQFKEFHDFIVSNYEKVDEIYEFDIYSS